MHTVQSIIEQGPPPYTPPLVSLREIANNKNRAPTIRTAPNAKYTLTSRFCTVLGLVISPYWTRVLPLFLAFPGANSGFHVPRDSRPHTLTTRFWGNWTGEGKCKGGIARGIAAGIAGGIAAIPPLPPVY